MKELLKISHGYFESPRGDSLRDYEICVHEGDIMYVQGLEDTGIRTLVRILEGETALDKGTVYFHGKRLEQKDRKAAMEQGLYVISGENNLVSGMTVADNLEAVRDVPFWLSVYHKKKAVRQAAAYLEKERVEISPEAYLWSVSRKNLQKLSIIKAKMHGASLIVLDMTGFSGDGVYTEELCELILRTNQEGISFLILSEHYSLFAEIATRIQVMSYGRDLKEWRGIHDQVRQILRDGLAVRREYRVPCGSSDSIRSMEDPERFLFGLYDREWEMREEIWTFLRFVKTYNRELWERYLNAQIPPDHTCLKGDTVVIPADSALQLPEHLSVTDHLILPLKKRLAVPVFGFIRKRVIQNVENQFHKVTGIDPKGKMPGELTLTERKILSIFRYTLQRPRILILENPYAGLNIEEIYILKSFLRNLRSNGVFIVCYSRDRQRLTEDCFAILETRGGKEGKMTTIS